ncbi:MAG: aminotransferase class V-fold PLP-dependent enzyme [Solirubrobacteraceae bacterium]
MGDMLDAFFPYRRTTETHRSIPAAGVSRGDVLAMVDEMARSEDAIAREGRVSGSIYHGGEEHFAFLADVYRRFAHVNVLQRDMYPSATKFEGEIVAMCAALLHGGESACGVLTFGGSESLFNAVLVYRERGRKRGIEAPQVVVPVTAHVAIAKAAHYLGVEVVPVPVTDGFVVDVDAVREAIGPQTVALFGSAGTYPHGLIDPIEQLGALALEHDIGLHVDGCLGGLILPWGERLGVEIPRWDFRVPGVTSISADTHKYGYAPKGTGVMLYADRELRRLQYFAYPDWSGGLYASPGIAGSRSGGLIAATWAAMVTLGERGYLDIAERIFRAAAEVRAAVEAVPELALIGNPSFCVAWRSDVVDVYHVNDALKDLGWRMNSLQLPPALHFCLTLPNTEPGVTDAFATDLAAAVEYAKSAEGPPRSGAMYGGAGTPEGNAQVNQMLAGVIDAWYEPAPPV